MGYIPMIYGFSPVMGAKLKHEIWPIEIGKWWNMMGMPWESDGEVPQLSCPNCLFINGRGDLRSYGYPCSL